MDGDECIKCEGGVIVGANYGAVEKSNLKDKLYVLLTDNPHMTYKDASKRMNVPRNTISRWAVDMGLRAPKDGIKI